jgi:hypothetical protein
MAGDAATALVTVNATVTIPAFGLLPPAPLRVDT